MKKLWSGVIAASFVATVGLSAQQAPPASPPAAPGSPQQPAPSAQASGQSKTVTLSGCIQNAPAASASATAAGASASASSAPKFVLSTKGGGAAGAGAAVGTSGTAMRYQLDGEEKAISPHLNHQVEITGTVQPAGASAASGATAAGPTLKVDSVKMVSATCS
jgi:hypothetical protein